MNSTNEGDLHFSFRSPEEKIFPRRKRYFLPVPFATSIYILHSTKQFVIQCQGKSNSFKIHRRFFLSWWMLTQPHQGHINPKFHQHMDGCSLNVNDIVHTGSASPFGLIVVKPRRSWSRWLQMPLMYLQEHCCSLFHGQSTSCKC